ncbi:chromate efflux transporter [Gryllotalpicola daejeonensis]|uniref:chromate efflux transporter n=1 Tax=Gryllotalpicola daejeonensis TaxID=993087 RepID=UPI0031DDF999
MPSDTPAAPPPPTPPAPRAHPGTAVEVFRVFLRLGLTSFGGPVAHLGYFRDAFVVRRRWFSEKAYADLVALCQFLPGPASSQVGMAIGLQRAGFLGLLAAWCAFTLPSAILLTAFAFGVTALGDVAGTGWLQGLKAAAVAVVAQAVLGMARTLAPDVARATIAVGAMIAALLIPSSLGQVIVIAASAVAGLLWLVAPEARTSIDETDAFAVRVPRGVAIAALAAFFALLAALPLAYAATHDGGIRLVDIFYRAGALVFGGGHVVLPLLQAGTVPTGLVSHTDFLAGYGAAQAVPGPLFTFSAFLGAVTTSGPSGLVGAAIALIAIFLPAFLLVVGALPFWDTLRGAPRVRRALMGVGAGVVGILAAALYTPVFTSGVAGAGHPALALAVAAAAFLALQFWKAPPWAVVIAAGVIGFLIL